MKTLLILTFIALSFAIAKAQTIEKEVVISPPKDGESRYYYVPFDIPKGTNSLSVSYRYDRKDGANVLDLGLFDSRSNGTETDLNGFRGWSGGRRSTIFVGRETASNGYLPGDLPTGKWRVILGLYKVVPEGVKVNISVRFNKIDTAALAERDKENWKKFDFEKTARTPPPDSGGLTWYRGDLHTHTFHSDGNWTLKGILDYASANNLDFVAVTEHNTKSHHADLEKLRKNYSNILVMTGEEVTTYGGHLNVWGLPSGTLIDFRVTPRDTAQLVDVLKPVRKLKIPASINHPMAICGGCNWTYGDDWAGMDSVEIWNGSWDATDELALRRWDDLLMRGVRITAIGSSDSHTLPAEPNSYGTNLAIGHPTTFIGAKTLTESDLFSSIRAHRVFITERPDRILSFSSEKTNLGGEVSVRTGAKLAFAIAASNFPAGSKMKLISDGKAVSELDLANGNIETKTDLVFAKSGYVRIEIRDSADKMLAMSNPIFVKVK
jgi:hypothetical protein